MYVHLSQGQLLARNHCNTRKFPTRAAYIHACVSHGHPCVFSQISISGSPCSAAYAKVMASHGAQRSRSHFRASKWPPLVAYAHTCVFQGQLLAYSQRIISRLPLCAARIKSYVLNCTPWSCAPISITKSPFFILSVQSVENSIYYRLLYC